MRYFQVKYLGRMVFFRQTEDLRASVSEAVQSGINLSPDNIDDERTRFYGADFPKTSKGKVLEYSKWTEEHKKQADILLLDVHIKEYSAP